MMRHETTSCVIPIVSASHYLGSGKILLTGVLKHSALVLRRIDLYGKLGDGLNIDCYGRAKAALGMTVLSC